MPWAGRRTHARDMNTSASDQEPTTDAGSDAGAGQEAPAGTAAGDAAHSSGDRTSDGAGTSAGTGSYYDSRPSAGSYGGFGHRDLCRPIDDRMLAGVASGIARYLDVDVTIVRVIFAVLAFVGGAGIPIYLAGWLLIPEEGAESSIASDLLSSLEGRSR